MLREHELELSSNMEANGISPPDQFIADGKIQRFSSNGRRKDNAGWYIIYDGEYPCAVYGDWRSGQTFKWRASSAQKLAPAERKLLAKKLEESREKADKQREEDHKIGSENAKVIWEGSSPITDQNHHPYLIKKRVLPHACRLSGKNQLIIPLRDTAGELTSLQFIGPEGDKLLLPKGKVHESFCLLGSLDDDVICIAEGWATAATIYNVTDYSVIAAMSCGNLLPVGRAIRSLNPKAIIVFCADDDHCNEKNPGLSAAKKATEEVGGLIAIPAFKNIRGEKDTDFNDLFIAEGENAVSEIINSAVDRGRSSQQKLCADGLPKGFRSSGNSIEYFDNGEQCWGYLCSYVVPVCLARTPDGEDWSLVLRIRDFDGNIHERSFPRSDFSGDGRAVREELLSLGLKLPPYNRARFDDYISSCAPPTRAISVKKAGWHHGAYVRADKVYGQTEEKMVLSRTRRLRDYIVLGDLKGWQENVGKLCNDNSRLMFSVAFALAGPILHPLGEENFAIHFYGASSIGKSTILDAAASIWGINVNSWRTTDNAAEGLCQQANDGMLCFDELSEADGRAADKLAYMIGNGNTKGRANRDGTAKAIETFRLVLLSSGECGLESKISEQGGILKAGQSVRLVEIPAVVANGYGAFENLHGYKSGAELSVELKKLSKTFKGAVADAFLNEVCVCLKHLSNSIRLLKEEWLSQFPKLSGQTHRVAEKFSLVAATGEWAIEHNILDWPKNSISRASAVLFQSWLDARGGTEPKEFTDAKKRLLALVTEHANSRFETLGTSTSVAHPDQKIANKAGFRRQTKDHKYEYYILQEVFKREIICNCNYDDLKVYFVEQGLIKRDNNNRYRVSVNTGVHGQMRLFHVPADAIEDLPKLGVE